MSSINTPFPSVMNCSSAPFKALCQILKEKLEYVEPPQTSAPPTLQNISLSAPILTPIAQRNFDMIATIIALPIATMAGYHLGKIIVYSPMGF